ncbi:MAG: hypothetical protein K0S01_1052 [Herbinix sp.]|jgi:uncharacterized protein (DUF1697 family)|nr:hypothetical protein [Herbinix sp.]
MTIYIALLRGINVGGKNMIKMTELKRMFETLGLSQVETYIQTGNIIFESNEKEAVLRDKIEYEIEKSFGASVAVVLRTGAELEQLIKDCPFSQDEIAHAETVNTEGESFYVCLMPQAPLLEKSEYLNKYRTEGDEFQIINRDMYILLHHSIRNSKLAINLAKLDVPATTRNWKTMNKLYSLVKDRTNSI